MTVSWSGSDVTAVMVTYQPSLELLAQALDRVQAQVGHVVVVDNASSAHVVAWLCDWQAQQPQRQLIRNDLNMGIATGFNQGIECARQQGQGAVLLLDQDSAVQPGMVKALAQAFFDGDRVAAAGPAFIDRRTAHAAPFVRIGWLFNHKVHVQPGQVVDCDFLISSGSLIALQALAQIGVMDDSLFIDNVDLEWSFRARAAGYRLLGVADAKMEHAIGDQVFSVPGSSGGLAFSLHGPRRLYYMTRNRLALYMRASTPAAWISQDIPRVVLKFIGMGFLVAPRWRNCRAMLLGGLDAMRGRMGPCRHRT